ncbi:MAG: Bug family tripartite tricarboxylate transporter substrate binding protein [Beijerinckiaceae bacterium]
MRHVFRKVCRTIAIGAVAAACAAPALAQQYPNRTVKIVVAAPPGGLTDVVARSVAQYLHESLKQPFVVENISGASSTIGATQVARAAPDGYTLLVNPSLLVITPMLMSVPYDVRKDFTPVSNLGNVPLALAVYPGIKGETLQDFISLVKGKPQDHSWAIEGIGAVGHLTVERLQLESGFKLVQVPYRGTAPALIDVMAGRVTAIISPVPNVLQHIRAGTLKPLAVTTKERVATLPNVPTMEESGFRGFEIGSWYGVWGPAGLPKDVLAILNRELSAAMKTPAVVSRLVEQGLIPVGSNSAEFAAFIASEQAKFEKLIKSADIKVGGK